MRAFQEWREANIAAINTGQPHLPEARPLTTTLVRLEAAWPSSDRDLFDALQAAPVAA